MANRLASNILGNNSLPLGKYIGFIIVLTVVGCAPHQRLSRKLQGKLKADNAKIHFSGLYLIDAQTGQDIFSYHADKAFTPASVTKVFTLYAALKELPEFVPSLRFATLNDTLYISGTGDPAPLHPELNDSTAIKLIRSFPNVIAVPAPFEDFAWGPGWSWEDYDQYYSPDRSTMPIYGNIVRMRFQEDSLVVIPAVFKDSLRTEDGSFARKANRNLFLKLPETQDTLDIPFKTSPELELRLWSEATGTPITPGEWPTDVSRQTLYGMSLDSLCQRMMAVSDNFLAEQLMVLVSSQLGDTLGFSMARNHLLENHLKDLPDAPRWVDGSGLSRYNLFTPRTVVHVLNKLYQEFPEDRLFSLMAKGGGNGTLQQWQNNTETVALYGKSGSMGGVQNLCGYLKTQGGRTLIFSFMNNHISGPGLPVKQRMHEILQEVSRTY